MTNQERALSIMGKVGGLEKAFEKALPHITDAAKASALSAAVAALHTELYTHASATAGQLGLDMNDLNLSAGAK